MKKSKKLSLAILGLYHMGCVYAASFAKLGFQVYGFDTNRNIVNCLKAGIPPIFEPNLENTIKKKGRNLHFLTSIEETVKERDYVFITYDLPVDNNDLVDTRIIDATFSQLSKYIQADTIIVISSQVSVGTSRKLVKLLSEKGVENPKVIYFPENLRLGQAMKLFLKPERIILGSENRNALDKFKKDFPFFKSSFITMNLESAEMAKHSLNCYLATCISLSCELSDLSERTGANMLDIVKALKTDKRVSVYAPINPGLGFSGGTLARDVQILRKKAKENNYEAKLLNSVYSVNQSRLQTLMTKINTIITSLKGKQVGILGLTYKPETSTLRRSVSLDLASLLHKKGCKIKAFDPIIKDHIPSHSFINICSAFDILFKDLDILLLMTEWPQFLKLDLPKLSPLMKNKVIIDTKNFLDYKTYKDQGFSYFGMGVSYK